MKKILLLDYNYTDGGPKTVNANLMHSELARKYEFKVVSNDDAVLHYNLIKAAKFVRFYVRQINKEHADIAYIRGLEYVGFLMTLAARLSNVKSSVLVVHGSYWDVEGHSLRQLILKGIIEPLEVMLADKIITVCNAERKTAKCLNFARRGSYAGTIYNTFPGIDYDAVPSGRLRSELGIPAGKIVVSSVGRVTDRKGHQYIIEALRKWHDPDFVFVIIGDGDYLDNYRRDCAEAIRQGRLYLLGSRSDVYELLKDTDIFLFTTLNENHSMALLEAVNMRCAAVVTNVGGNTETIHDGKSGIVIEPRSSDQIIQALGKLKDKAVRKRYADAAYAFAKEHFSRENTLGKLDRLFQSLTSAN